VSEPAPELTKDQVRQQAGNLAEIAANAAAKAHAELKLAAIAAEAAEKRLWAVAYDIPELPKQADLVRESKHPSDHLVAAQKAADKINDQLAEAQADVAEIQKKRGKAALPLRVAMESLDQIDELSAD
jgi:hypothetical protein